MASMSRNGKKIGRASVVLDNKNVNMKANRPTLSSAPTRPSLRAEVLSSPEVGSSKISTLGSCMASTPMETRRFSPPDMPRTLSSPILVLATWLRPSSRISDLTLEHILLSATDSETTSGWNGFHCKDIEILKLVHICSSRALVLATARRIKL
ncbi:hypothetical protein CR513_30530, partial [Mucuna pruriens]